MASGFLGNTNTTSTGSQQDPNAPLTPGVTSTDQAGGQKQTGAGPVNIGGGGQSGSAGPSTAAASGSASAAQPSGGGAAGVAASNQPVDFGSWLGANQQGVQNQTSALTSSAVSTGTALNNAANNFASAASQQVAGAGQATAFNPSGGAPTVAQINAATTSQYSGPTASSLSAGSQYSNVNNAAGKAAQASQSLRNGGSQSNAWDYAAQRASGGAKQQTLQAQGALGQQQSQAAGTAAQAGQAANAAQTSWNNTVDANKAALGQVVQSGANTASSNVAGVQRTASTASSAAAKAASDSSPSEASAALSSYTNYLTQLGVAPADIQTAISELSAHQISPQQAMQWMQSVISTATDTGAGAYTGYNANTAAVQNAANAKLGNGNTVSAGSNGAVSTGGLANDTAQNQAAVQNAKQQALAFVNKQVASAGGDPNNSYNQQINNSPDAMQHAVGLMEQRGNDFAPLDNAVGYLMANGMSFQEIADAFGLSGSVAAAFVQHYTQNAGKMASAYNGQDNTNWSAQGNNTGQNWGSVVNPGAVHMSIGDAERARQ